MRILLYFSALLLLNPTHHRRSSTAPSTSSSFLTPASAYSLTPTTRQRLLYQLYSTTEALTNVALEFPDKTKETTTLGLITFDLDDTLYPIAPVIREANTAFARAMKKYGYPDIEPDDINRISAELRTTREDGALLSHTEMRRLAIRAAMEEVTWKQKLVECAQDWATNVESLGPAVVASAKRYVNTQASTALSVHPNGRIALAGGRAKT